MIKELKMQTKSGIEYSIGKSENNNLVIQVGDEFAEITSLEIKDEAENNISINYSTTENFDVNLIGEIAADLLNKQAVTDQLKMEPISDTTELVND
jgi:hypothetical protein